MAEWTTPHKREDILVLDGSSYVQLIKILFGLNPAVTIAALVLAAFGLLGLLSIDLKEIFWLLPFIGAAWVAPSTRLTGDLITAAIWNQDVVNNVQFLYDRVPRRATLWHDEDTVTSGNAIIFTVNTGQAYNFVAEQGAAYGLGDAFEQGFYLQAGTYTVYFLGRTRSDCGKVDWTLDGTLIVNDQNWYSAGATDNVVKSQASVVVVGSGRHVLQGELVDVGTGGGDYRLQLTKVWFVPAADDTEVS